MTNPNTTRVGDLKIGDQIMRHNGTTATLVSVVPAPERYRVDGIWMMWSDGLGPFVADPDWQIPAPAIDPVMHWATGHGEVACGAQDADRWSTTAPPPNVTCPDCLARYHADE